jgi:hypothetical protein
VQNRSLLSNDRFIRSRFVLNDCFVQRKRRVLTITDCRVEDLFEMTVFIQNTRPIKNDRDADFNLLFHTK